jgi:hypothetical protein
MTAAGVRIVGGLFVDMESAPPRAKYVCLLCDTTDGPVVGRGKVAAFVPDARLNHRATCPAYQQGAQAA